MSYPPAKVPDVDLTLPGKFGGKVRMLETAQTPGQCVLDLPCTPGAELTLTDCCCCCCVQGGRRGRASEAIKMVEAASGPEPSRFSVGHTFVKVRAWNTTHPCQMGALTRPSLQICTRLLL